MNKYSYQCIILFVLISIIGVSLLSRLSVQLVPSQGGRSIIISYLWRGAPPKSVEQQVTTPLEAIFGTIASVKKISSVSSYNEGHIIVELDDRADVDAIRFELTALVRQIYPKLPSTVDYPQVSLNSSEEQSDANFLMTIQLSNPALTATQLQHYANDQIRPLLSTVDGISDVAIFGGNQTEWVFRYNTNVLINLQISENDIRQALQLYFQREPLGHIALVPGHTLRVRLDNSMDCSSADCWSHIPITKRNNRIIYLTDLVTVTHEESPTEQFYRINGKTAINIVLTAGSGVNQLIVSQKLRFALAHFFLPVGYKLYIDYDATEFIRENIYKTGIQTSIAIIVLVLFIAITTRNISYVLLIVISTIVSILLSIIIFVLFKIEIHLYSLAALATSLGIVMDNVIIMIDHYRYHRNLQVFASLLGATLTTCAGLIVVWFLPEENRQALSDFSAVIIITLFSSLLTASIFTPAILERFWLVKYSSIQKPSKKIWHKLKRKIRNERLYLRVLSIVLRYRRLAVLGAVLLFGLPVFQIPTSIDSKYRLASAYNKVFGSNWYNDNIQPNLVKWFGGTLRLFVNYVYEGSYERKTERTALYIHAALPSQSTPEQMNAIFQRFELVFSQYHKIDKFITHISNGQEGNLIVYFKEQYDTGIFPYQLKNQAILLSTEMSGVDWDIFGVGQGFNQSLNEQISTFNIEMYGYNLNQLEQLANLFKEELKKNSRIQKININRSVGLYQRKRLDEFVFNINAQILALRGIGISQLYVNLSDLNVRPIPDLYTFVDNKYEAIKIIPIQNRTIDVWQLQNQRVSSSVGQINIRNAGEIMRQSVAPEIYRENQQFKRLISFEYSGSYHFGEKFLTRKINEFNSNLPLGYKVQYSNQAWFNNSSQIPYELLALILVLIYIVCSITFENLLQPLSLIVLIPLSYVGVFLAFYWTNSNFDQGGYASLILLSGNVVCAGIFIISEMNRLKRRYPNLNQITAYSKAFRHKIGPVMLTILSTVVGMFPFLLYEQEPFWYALGIGTIGGLLMSILALGLYLPLFLLKNSNLKVSHKSYI